MANQTSMTSQNNKLVYSYWPSHVTPSPVKPGRHSHSKLPIVLVHVALLEQLSSFRQHSSMSVKVHPRVVHLRASNYMYCNRALSLCPYNILICPTSMSNWRHVAYWPSHVTPSPIKPARQSHSKLPMVLVHVALPGSQLSCPRVHSSRSVVVMQ